MERDKEILRDKINRSRRSKIMCDIHNCSNVKMIENMIDDLENGGPAGLLHVAALSSVVKKAITIRSSKSNIITSFGDTKMGDVVEIQFHEQHEQLLDASDGYSGHWSLLDNKDPESQNCPVRKNNNCLFDAVAVQIGAEASDLRKLTATKLRENVQFLRDSVEDIRCLDRRALMLGGARYRGRNAHDAKIVIDKSQNARCYNYQNRGHPRGHASCSNTIIAGPTDCVENYSSTGLKTAFLTRADQDYVAHLALSNETTQMAMHQLNRGSVNQVVRLASPKLGNSRLPEAREWYNGYPTGEAKAFRNVVLVLRHHVNEYKNPEADVFVMTFYPQL